MGFGRSVALGMDYVFIHSSLFYQAFITNFASLQGRLRGGGGRGQDAELHRHPQEGVHQVQGHQGRFRQGRIKGLINMYKYELVLKCS